MSISFCCAGLLLRTDAALRSLSPAKIPHEAPLLGHPLLWGALFAHHVRHRAVWGIFFGIPFFAPRVLNVNHPPSLQSFCEPLLTVCLLISQEEKCLRPRKESVNWFNTDLATMMIIGSISLPEDTIQNTLSSC
ncbi:hypothetical protein CDAR_205781 [Caerostris darwini]|uniref:Uncharacterized protein n=1 Tax=Caerostris darwini TaxID=1538125 RepID=A0AAV4WZK4_9ARAC|nr:hypothetical protein CDAR_205781 [Caerostris darwini]